MTSSPELNHLATALTKVQAALQPAIKGKNNPFFSSKYADLGAVWDAARGPLTENGLAVTQVVDMQLNTASGALQPVLCTMLLHTSGQWIGSAYPLNPVKPDPQAMGSAVTYARRYAFSAIIGMVTEEDDDGNAASAKGISKGASVSAGSSTLTIAHLGTASMPYRVTFSDGREAAFFDDGLLVSCANLAENNSTVVPTIQEVVKGGKTYFNLTAIKALA